MKKSANTFTLKSDELGGQFESRHYANGMGYSGDNQSPQLYWEHPPEQTESFALTIYDLDAPTGSGFWHWVLFNLPASASHVPSGAGDPGPKLLPEGTIQGRNDAGIPGYIGAAPPEGPAHRYLITVHALRSKLELDEHATPALVGFNLHFATLARASMLVYGQKQ